MSQCDGCNARLPIIEGKHRMGTGAYPDWMFCQRLKYPAPVQEQRGEQDQ